MTLKFKLLVLRAGDLAKSRAFYDCIGLELKLEQHGAGPERYACEMDGFVLEIYPSRSTEASQAEEMLGFEVASLDAVLVRLAAIGFMLQRQPVATMQGLRVVIADPDGRRIELIEPRQTK
jgi:catechol 2,3-dioxygenase-like lactoylglutathione lyase family enzyme